VKPVADSDGDGKSDLGWQHTDGRHRDLHHERHHATATQQILTARGVVDHARAGLNGDGKADLVFQNTDGSVAVWTMNGTAMTAAHRSSAAAPAGASSRRRTSTATARTTPLAAHRRRHRDLADERHPRGSPAARSSTPGLDRDHTAADLNGDGKADLVFQHTDGTRGRRG
jgi:hypothetical protein